MTDSNSERCIILIRVCKSTHDATSVMFEWGNDVRREASSAGIRVLESCVTTPNHNRYARRLLQERQGKSDLLVFYGHGNESSLLLLSDGDGNPQRLLRAGNLDDILVRKQICATACSNVRDST